MCIVVSINKRQTQWLSNDRGYCYKITQVECISEFITAAVFNDHSFLEDIYRQRKRYLRLRFTLIYNVPYQGFRYVKEF